MSYTLRPYLLSLKQLRSALGRGSQDLRAKLSEVHQTIFGDPNDRDGSGFTTLRAGEELLRGELTRPDLGHEYAYGLQLICAAIGEPLPREMHTDVHGLESGAEEYLLPRGDPVPLPKRPNFPYLGYLSAARAQKLIKELDDDWVSQEDDPELQQARDEFRGWVACASEQAKDLVGFYW